MFSLNTASHVTQNIYEHVIPVSPSRCLSTILASEAAAIDVCRSRRQPKASSTFVPFTSSQIVIFRPAQGKVLVKCDDREQAHAITGPAVLVTFRDVCYSMRLRSKRSLNPPTSTGNCSLKTATTSDSSKSLSH